MARREIPIFVGTITPMIPGIGLPGSPPGQISQPLNPSFYQQYGQFGQYPGQIGYGQYNPFYGFTQVPFNNLADPSATMNPYMTNYLGTLQGGLTSPTASTGLGGSGMAQITNISFPPATAVGTSFPLQVSFVNNSPQAAQFSLVITAEQLGVDQVKTPPIPVQPGQPGLITQPMQMPTLLPPPGAVNYVISVQLIHTDVNGSQIVDDSRSVNIPAPTAAITQPGQAVNPSTGQISSPTGTLPASPVPQGAIPTSTTPLATPIIGLNTNRTPVLAPAVAAPISSSTQTHITTPTFSFPKFSFPKSFGFFAGAGAEGEDRNRKAFIHCDQEHGYVTVRGHNFSPGEDIAVHHHIVVHGHENYDGNVLEDDDYAQADHTGRFIISLPIPSFLMGLFGDGIVSVRGERSGKKAKGTTSFR